VVRLWTGCCTLMWSSSGPDVALWCVSAGDLMMQSNLVPPIFGGLVEAFSCLSLSFYHVPDQNLKFKLLLVAYGYNHTYALYSILLMLNGGASFRWSFGPHSAWGSIESTTILTTYPSLQLLVWQSDILCLYRNYTVTIN